ncbi:hypothetical protein [uncultured Microbacterium sp.]|uniref:hypothetical protein n=1 Tax=uncultured Microbacterium sp. TaxID=191216 RepID=UPI0026187EF9|nr:hypothetical protein [uncultured Microbacterium sp.]
MTTRRTLALLALLGAGALAFSGCASTPAAPGASGGSDDSSTELEVDAAWLDGGRMVAIVTQGSGTCVPTASSVTLQADGSVAVTLEDPAGDTACTRDLVPRATGVQLPEGANGDLELELVVTYGDLRGDTDLDSYSGGPVEEYAPSAGWVDDGQFALLTWGSSSCAPMVQDATVAEGNQITVTFTDPPADQVCTADMAPRVTLVAVDDVEDNVVDLTLTGGGVEFETPVQLEIVG